MDPNGLFSLYVWCSNKYSNDSAIFLSKLPFPVNISSTLSAELAVLEMSLPGRWFNVPERTPFYIYDVINRDKQVQISIPPGYYNEFKKIAQLLNTRMELAENKIDGKKL